MTLDEWKALQKNQTQGKPQFNIRQAGEGVDNGQWKKGFEYHKKHEEEDDEDEDEEEDEVIKEILMFFVSPSILNHTIFLITYTCFLFPLFNSMYFLSVFFSLKAFRFQ